MLTTGLVRLNSVTPSKPVPAALMCATTCTWGHDVASCRIHGARVMYQRHTSSLSLHSAMIWRLRAIGTSQEQAQQLLLRGPVPMVIASLRSRAGRAVLLPCKSHLDSAWTRA